MDCFKVDMIYNFLLLGLSLQVPDQKVVFLHVHVLMCLFFFCLFPGLLKIGLRTAFAHISQLVEQYYECIQG